MMAVGDTGAPLAQIRDLAIAYRTGWRQSLRAVDGVSLDIPAGSTVALIGESGSGKSSIARSICGLGPIERGSVTIGGQDVAIAPDRAAAAGALGVTIVFQDPTSALDPRWPVWRAIIEPRLNRFPAAPAQHRARAEELMRRVGLDPSMAERRPHQLSGGQRQRVTIARALAGEPRLVILDEAVSALDVSVRNEILALLERLKREEGLTYLFISHDMGAVVQIATLVAVLYLGKIVEIGATEAFVRRPLHPYTQALLRAVPTLAGDRARQPLEGETGDPANPPAGCRFHPRCPFRVERCESREPELRYVDARPVACHRAEEIMAMESLARTTPVPAAPRARSGDAEGRR